MKKSGARAINFYPVSVLYSVLSSSSSSTFYGRVHVAAGARIPYKLHHRDDCSRDGRKKEEKMLVITNSSSIRGCPFLFSLFCLLLAYSMYLTKRRSIINNDRMCRAHGVDQDLMGFIFFVKSENEATRMKNKTL